MLTNKKDHNILDDLQDFNMNTSYNNIEIAPTKIIPYKIVYPYIKKINAFNEHRIEKRQITIDDDNTQIRFVYTEPKPILLHFNINETITIIDSLPLMDAIILSKIPIYTIIDSICTDAMILPFLMGKRRYMYEHSHIYITRLFYDHPGDTLEDKMINLQTFQNKIINIFKKYTKMPSEIYKRLFKRELFLDSKTSLEYGLVDKII